MLPSNSVVLIMSPLGYGVDSKKHWRKEEKDRRKTLKSEETEKRRIRRMSNNNIYFFGYILLENIIWKKFVYTIKFYLQFLCVAGYLKHSNDTLSVVLNLSILAEIICVLFTLTSSFVADRKKIQASWSCFFFQSREWNKNVWSCATIDTGMFRDLILKWRNFQSLNGDPPLGELIFNKTPSSIS